MGKKRGISRRLCILNGEGYVQISSRFGVDLLIGFMNITLCQL